MTLDEFLASTLKTAPLAVKTKENYLGAYRRWVSPRFGALPLGAISSDDVRSVLVGLSAPSAYQVLMVLKMVFREARLAGLVSVVPTDGVRSERVVVPRKRFLRWEEIEGLDFGRWDAQVRFLALHGLRWSEAVVLSWDDIRDGRVHVWRSVHGKPKSAAGNRVVPYVGCFAPFPKDRRTLAKVLQPHGVTIHSLRHTYAYLLKSSGVHVTTAQRLLGHSSVSVTLDIYTDVLDSEIDVAGIQLAARAGINTPSLRAS